MATKDLWVDALRARLGRPEAPLRRLEVVTPTVVEDVHLLNLFGLASSAKPMYVRSFGERADGLQAIHW